MRVDGERSGDATRRGRDEDIRIPGARSSREYRAVRAKRMRITISFVRPGDLEDDSSTHVDSDAGERKRQRANTPQSAP